ncbi:platelet glycoprotein IX isoform X3 [Eublepharis macularius]|uniref:Platelet glycoprotein IX isoform X3 n=1 Tax=Eublepharis macularius TaxID=481883 RepID=A0AA97J5H9_EUBMA|nr:platelet glycoprotein IX isoform X3 [Eublepharis macularius]
MEDHARNLCNITAENEWRMVTCQGLLIFLFLETSYASSCPDVCTCSPSNSQPLKVDCSFRELETLPLIPNSTQELYLQHNNLESIPAGAFDYLQGLNVINLSSNPWHCDCGLWYLKNWMEDQAGGLHSSGVKCSSPPSLRQKPMSELTNELTSCSSPTKCCFDFLYIDAFLLVLVTVWFSFLIGSFMMVKKIKFIMKI